VSLGSGDRDRGNDDLRQQFRDRSHHRLCVEK
jgi:hypothetical protein